MLGLMPGLRVEASGYSGKGTGEVTAEADKKCWCVVTLLLLML